MLDLLVAFEAWKRVFARSALRVAAFTCAAAVAFGAPAVHAQQLSDVLKEAFTGAQFRDYKWLDYPLDSFGVASAYRGRGTMVADSGFLCSTFECVGSEVPRDSTKWMQVMTVAEPTGYASVGCGGNVSATLQQVSQVGGHAFLSSVLKVLSFDASASSERARKVNLTFTESCVRKLKQGKYEGAIDARPNDSLGLSKAYAEGTLVVIVGDIVVSGLHIVVEPDVKMQAALQAELNGAVSKALTGPAGLKAEVSLKQSGTYELTLDRPMIVGYLAVQRGGRPLGRTFGAVPTDTDWLDWEPVTQAIPVSRP